MFLLNFEDSALLEVGSQSISFLFLLPTLTLTLFPWLPPKPGFVPPLSPSVRSGHSHRTGRDRNDHFDGARTSHSSTVKSHLLWPREVCENPLGWLWGLPFCWTSSSLLWSPVGLASATPLEKFAAKPKRLLWTTRHASLILLQVLPWSQQLPSHALGKFPSIGTPGAAHSLLRTQAQALTWEHIRFMAVTEPDGGHRSKKTWLMVSGELSGPFYRQAFLFMKCFLNDLAIERSLQVAKHVEL